MLRKHNLFIARDMNEIFESSQKKCIDSITRMVLETEKFKEPDEAIRHAVLSAITAASKIAFAEGYDTGYCNAMDETQKIG